MAGPCVLALVALLLRTAAASLPSAAVLRACAAGDAGEALTINGGGIGVISSDDGCLCNNGGPGPLTFSQCEGSGPQHDREVGYAFTGGPSAIPWAASGLCVTAAATGGAVSLAACAPGSLLQQFEYDAAARHVVHNASGQCLALAPQPPPLLSTVFGSHMVLQRDAPAALWGWTTPGATVAVDFAGSTYTSLPSAADGRWSVSLPSTSSSSSSSGSGGYNITVRALDGSGAVDALTDVLFGDVIWCSGQVRVGVSHCCHAAWPRALCSLVRGPARSFARLIAARVSPCCCSPTPWATKRCPTLLCKCVRTFACLPPLT